MIRAANTGRVLGFRIGPLNVLSASYGFIDHYRNGYVIRWRSRKLGFVPTTGWRGSYVPATPVDPYEYAHHTQQLSRGYEVKPLDERGSA